MRAERSVIVGEQGERLRQMLELAQIARGWNRAQLADALGRDPSRLVPASGNPKLDTIVRLSRILEWPIGDVVESLYDSTSDTLDLFLGTTMDPSIEDRMEGLDAEGLYQLALELHVAGNWHECLIVARRMRILSDDQEFIASGYSIETVCWMNLGRFVNAVNACKAGLERTTAPDWLRRNLQLNLAYCLYLLSDLQLALGAADLLIRRLGEIDPPSKAEIGQLSAIKYVRANVHRRLIVQETSYRGTHIRDAEADYRDVIRLSEEYEGAWEGTPFAARRLGSQLGLIEVGVERGSIEPTAGIKRIIDHLSGFECIDNHDAQILEELAWGCIYGCNMAVRHLHGSVRMQSFAILSNKALEIAAHLGNWAIRERVYSLQCVVQEANAEPLFALDDEDRAEIVAVMGRFPTFYARGWSLLDPGNLNRR